MRINLKPQQPLFIIEGVRGGHSADEDQGDLCIDDVFVFGFECGGNMRSHTVFMTSLLCADWSDCVCVSVESNAIAANRIAKYIPTDSWFCDFGVEVFSEFSFPCGFLQSDEMMWSWRLIAHTNMSDESDAEVDLNGKQLAMHINIL